MFDKENHMKAWTKVVIGIGLIASLAVPVAAETDLGQFCWKLDPFVDIMRLSVKQADGPEAIFPIEGRIRANATAGQQAVGGAGPAVYQLLMSGSVSDTVGNPNTLDAGASAVHNTAFFGGNMGCNFHGVINVSFPPLSGTYEVECPGPVPYTKSGTLTFLSPCPAE
jgi:hypothetical protein